jgi:cobalt-zinc-cadmium resistance protein CzcA
MGGEFIPSLEEGDFAVEMRILQGSNINETKKVTTQASGILLKQFPEIQKIVVKIGSAEIPTEPMPMDAGDMIIVLKPKKEWTSAKSFPELSEKMSKALSVIPGLTTSFQFPVQMRFNELMTGARQDVVCKIYGKTLTVSLPMPKTWKHHQYGKRSTGPLYRAC